MSEKIKAISLFSSAGIGELLLQKEKINVIAANELLQARADCYSYFNPKTNMICGDITDTKIKNRIVSLANEQGVKLLIATPPCQGLSTLGKNKGQIQYENDSRNYLILEVLDIIDRCDFDYILIENVPKFIEMYFPSNGDYKKLEEILRERFSEKYIIDIKVLNAKDYGVAQSRPRAIIKLWKKNLKWSWPKKEKEITLKEAIGHLPSLEPGQDSGFRCPC